MENQKFTKFCLSLIFLLFNNYAVSSSTGITNQSGANGGTICTVCHSGGLAPTVVISGSNNVIPGSTNSYTITITNGQKKAGGFNISDAGSGTLLVPAGTTGIKKSGQELTHTTPANSAGDAAGTISWNFDWRAPATTGNYTLFGAGLSANLDGSQTGDNASKTSLAISVAAPLGTIPIAAISSPLTALPGATVLFDGTKSTASAGATNITQYEWSIDGAAFFTGSNIYTQTSGFTTTGRHTITLKVTDSSGATSVITFADIIIANTTIPVVNHTGPYTGVTGTAVNFDASTSITDSSTSITSYVWDFGDGSSVATGPSATFSSISHTYTTANTYTVTIVAQDGNGMSGVSSTTVIVTAKTLPLTGEELYNANCLSCHGAAGIGLSGVAPFVKGATNYMINGEINNVTQMQGINLSNQQTQLIADYLGSGGTTGQDYYTNKCLICHGLSGKGGSGFYGGPNIQSSNTSLYFDNISKTLEMNGISLTIQEAQNIQNFLKGGGN